MARAENAFGPPSPNVGPLARIQLGIELGWRADALLRPIDPNSLPVDFDIGLDEPTSQIVRRMQEAGLVREAGLFSDYLVYTGLDTQLLAGNYSLSPAMNAVQIATALLDPTPETVTLVILPGWRLEEIAAALPAAGVSVSQHEFLLAAWNPPADLQLPDGFPEEASLEGYLLPGSYEIDRHADAIGLLNTVLEEFNAQVDAELRAGFEQQGLVLHEAVTLASIVERETVVQDEMPLIASVFLNRLKADMPLEADPTVQFALGYDAAGGTWWKTKLTSADLQIDSPYNTYAYFGLPPGPIAAPSLQALQAIAHPATTDFYYFQAACDGSGRHVFALTYEEHLANNCE